MKPEEITFLLSSVLRGMDSWNDVSYGIDLSFTLFSKKPKQVTMITVMHKSHQQIIVIQSKWRLMETMYVTYVIEKRNI